MRTAPIGGVELAYRVDGEGEPVVLIHAAGLADFFAPLHDSDLQKSALIISYHRIGYGRSGPVTGPVEVVDQAEHCAALLEFLGYRSAHVVGHSSGGVIALELARRSPGMVSTLCLLEPSLPVASSPQLSSAVMRPAFAAYLAGDHALAVDTFLAGVCGPDYPSRVDELLPGARRQAARDAGTLFGVEAPAVGRWKFDPQWLTDIRMPVLSVLGEWSDRVSPVSREAHELLLARLPRAEGYILPRATHLLQLHNAQDLAGAIARFIRAHAMDG